MNVRDFIYSQPFITKGYFIIDEEKYNNKSVIMF